MAKCSTPACVRPASRREWCDTHYRRWLKRRNDPNFDEAAVMAEPISKTRDALGADGQWRAFMERCDTEAPRTIWRPDLDSYAPWTPADSLCLVARASFQSQGYAYIWIDGCPARAHRMAWERAHGLAPGSGVVLDHLCRNRPCVQVAHLEPVSQTENLRRAWIGRRLDRVDLSG